MFRFAQNKDETHASVH